MRTSSRRTLLGWAVFLGGGTALVAFLQRQGEPPPADWVRDSLWGDDLIAYAVWDGVPRAAVEVWPGRVSYDRMIPGDWFWPTWPPRPRWQLAGLGYSIAASTAPATVGYAPCVGVAGERCTQPTELFGQINNPTIVAMKVQVGEAWQRFDVAAPGFAVRLDGVTREPTGYRWLDAAERTIWEINSHSATSPGARGQRRRNRRNATPVPATRIGSTPRHDMLETCLHVPVAEWRGAAAATAAGAV